MLLDFAGFCDHYFRDYVTYENDLFSTGGESNGLKIISLETFINGELPFVPLSDWGGYTVRRSLGTNKILIGCQIIKYENLVKILANLKNSITFSGLFEDEGVIVAVLPKKEKVLILSLKEDSYMTFSFAEAEKLRKIIEEK